MRPKTHHAKTVQHRQEKVVFRSQADKSRLSPFSLKFLEKVVLEANAGHFEVTSVVRTVAEQASAMYDKLSQGRIDHYKSAGKAVQHAYFSAENAGHHKSQILKAMRHEIEKQGLSNVTNHAGRYALDVLDVTANENYLTREARQRVVALLRRYHGFPIHAFGHEGGKKGDKFEFIDHDCIHIEIIQPEEAQHLTTIA